MLCPIDTYMRIRRKPAERIRRRTSFGVSRSFRNSESSGPAALREEPEEPAVADAADFRLAPYPAFSTASMIASGEASPSTPMEFVSRLTATEVTPGTEPTAFSTRAEHAAQLIPVTLNCCIFLLFLSGLSGSCDIARSGYCFISFCMTRLLHQFLHNLDELIDRLVFSGADVIRHAGPHMARHQFLVETVERRGHCRNLSQDIRAVRVFFEVKDRFIFCFTVCFCFLFAPGLALWFVFYNANLYTPHGYISYAISIYPPGVCVNNIKRTTEKFVIAELLLGK